MTPSGRWPRGGPAPTAPPEATPRGRTEVQQTFYQPPRRATAERWRARAAADFVFTLEAWQLITHRPSSRTYRRTTEPLSARLVADTRRLRQRLA